MKSKWMGMRSWLGLDRCAVLIRHLFRGHSLAYVKDKDSYVTILRYGPGEVVRGACCSGSSECMWLLGFENV